jgi:parvulin-like peptidyl-prolyl isomerase
MDNIKFIFFVLVFTILMFSCKNKDKVAVFNDGYVCHYEVIDRFKSLSVEDKKNINTDDDIYKFIRKIALEKIILDKAIKENFDKKDSLIKELEKSKKQIGFDILKKRNVIDKISINRDDYKKYTKTYNLYQIVKRINVNDPKKIEAEKTLLKDIAKNIKDIEAFKEYAKKYSDDITAQSDGYVGKIRLGVMEEQIDNVISKLPTNKVSDVVESSSGLHLLYVSSIDEVKIDDLLYDKELFNSIYNEKRIKLEESWYENLIKDTGLKIDEKSIKENIQDDQIVVISYKDKKVTAKEFFDIVNSYKQSNFPEPTQDDLLKLAKSIALNIIIEKKALDPAITKSKEFKDKLEKEKKFLMLNDYVSSKITQPVITDELIKNFYEQNKSLLFTFKLDDGRIYIQPIDEVKKFIAQKLESALIQESKINMYKKIIDDEKLVINNDKIAKIKIDIAREKI